MSKFRNILVTGGAGYVGAVLVPKLLDAGYKVKVIDLYIYGEDVLDRVKNNPNLVEIKGDIRDRELLEKEIQPFLGGCPILVIVRVGQFLTKPKKSFVGFHLTAVLGQSLRHVLSKCSDYET